MKNILALLLHLKPYKSRLILCAIFNLMVAIFTIVSIPFIIPFFQIIFDTSSVSISPPESIFDIEGQLIYYFSNLISITSKNTALLLVCGSLFVFILLRNLFRYLTSYCLIPIRNGILRDLREKVFHSFVSLDIPTIEKYTTGDLLSIGTTDITEIDWSVVRTIELLFKTPIIIIGSLIIMFAIQPILSSLALIILIFIGILLGNVSLHLKKTSTQNQKKLADIHDLMQDTIDGKKTLRSLRSEDFFKKIFKTLNFSQYKLYNKILLRKDLASPLSEVLIVGLILILIIIGVRFVITGQMRPESFFAFIIAFYNVVEPSKSLSSTFFYIQKASASLDRISRFNELSTSKKLVPFQNKFPEKWEKITFENVCFSYDQASILNHLSFTLNREEKIAIVGKSGAGKSTIVDLFLQFYSPDKGSITVDNEDIHSINSKDYRSQIAYVSQSPKIFNFDLKNNILLGRSYNENKYHKSLNLSQLYPIINQINKEPNAILGNTKDQFSIGELQRISIARAAYDEPQIWLIDEATTALDAESEKKVLESLHQLMRNKTALIISHNFRLIQQADRILVLEDGRISQIGNHEFLLVSSPLYRSLYDMQDRAINFDS